MLAFSTVSELRAEYARTRSGHFFDRDTTRFFGSRYGRTVYGGRYFLTSEARAAWGAPWRRYTVREIVRCEDGTYDIETVGGFRAFDSAADARKAIKALLAPEVQP